MKLNKQLHFETRAILHGEESQLDHYGDVVHPIHLSSTYAREKVEVLTKGHEYSRSDNPTRLAVEKRLASLEGAAFGYAFSSGLAAETTALMSVLQPGDHVIAFHDLYGGTRRLFEQVIHKLSNIEFTYVDASNINNIEKNIKDNTQLIWLECPTNPLLSFCDIAAITSIAKKKNILTLIDNTFMSPYFQKPLRLGADISLHSATKYLNGHSDIIGGCIMLNDSALAEKIGFMQNAIGAILGPFESYLLLRGTKTLAIRMNRHEENSCAVAQYLARHAKVERVVYPGLESHPNHDLAKKQCSGFGGIVSFFLKTDVAHTKKFLENLQLLHIAESLGGVESLIEIPSLMTHASISKECRDIIGIPENLVRLSVGIEHVQDIIDDLEHALLKV